MVTKKDIFDMLASLGIRSDDKLTMHISLRAVGKAENGADGIIDAFCEYLSNGLFIIPTHTWATVTRENPFFDVKSSMPCIGTLPTVAAKRPDAVRSLHPTHSVAVFGKGAEDWVKGEEYSSTPASPTGALGRLYDEGGKILLVGVGHERNTYLHVADEILNLPNRLDPDGFVITITDKNGNTIKSNPFHPHKVIGVPIGCSEYYPNYKKALEYFGAVKYSSLGNATVTLCDAKKTTDAVLRLWKNAEYDLCVADGDVPEKYYVEN